MTYYMGEWLSFIRREVERTIRKHQRPTRVGLVSSYDKKKHAVKVQYQPTGKESGWIPLTSHAVGNKFGHLHAPKIKDQVEVEFQNGDQMVGHVRLRHFSKLDQPPELELGEYAKIHETGSGIWHYQDGTVKHVGPQYYKTGQSGQGQSGNTQTGQQNGTSQNQQQQQQQKKAGKQNWQYNPDGSTVFNNPDPSAQGDGQPQNPKYTATVKKDINHTSTQGNWNRSASSGTITDTAQQGISRSAQQQISDTAKTISHHGDVDVAGDLEASSFIDASAFNITSDRRIKSGFNDLTDVLSRVMRLPLRSFIIQPSKMVDGKIVPHLTQVSEVRKVVTHDKIGPDGELQEQTHEIKIDFPLRRSGQSRKTIGAVAQEVRELFPEIVHGDEKTQILSLEEGKLGVLALAALKEYVVQTDAKIASLEARIVQLEKK